MFIFCTKPHQKNEVHGLLEQLENPSLQVPQAAFCQLLEQPFLIESTIGTRKLINKHI